MLLSEPLVWSEEEKELIPEIDRLFAALIVKKDHQALFLAFLLGSARAGFLYVDLENLAVEEVWEGALHFSERIRKGAQDLPDGVVQVGSKIYLKRLFAAEAACFEEWLRIASAPALPLFNESMLQELSLNQDQRKAVEMGCSSSLFVLTGGPGTGKTFTAGRLLRTLHRSSLKPLHMVAAAPTGKAALTLQTALQKFMGEEIPIKAKTLHALLDIKGGKFPEVAPILPYDVILVDEASMIDVELMALLLRSVKTGAQLIFLGDPHQLPPVEGAPIFPSLIKSHAKKVELKKCLRAESVQLLDGAAEIQRTGTFTPNAHVKLLDAGTDLKETIYAHMTQFTQEEPDFQPFRILTPLRKGPAGSDAINRMIFQALPKEGVRYIPLMITVNDYRFDLYNGEIGILKTHQKEFPFTFSEEDWVYFPNKPKFPALLLPRFELAYAMTVHKSQGSEFGNVLLLLPKTGKAPSRALLYTAFTRARKSITIWQE